jgi:hypothetical protein
VRVRVLVRVLVRVRVRVRVLAVGVHAHAEFSSVSPPLGITPENSFTPQGVPRELAARGPRSALRSCYRRNDGSRVDTT